jgi:hypothetical protein
MQNWVLTGFMVLMSAAFLMILLSNQACIWSKTNANIRCAVMWLIIFCLTLTSAEGGIYIHFEGTNLHHLLVWNTIVGLCSMLVFLYYAFVFMFAVDRRRMIVSLIALFMSIGAISIAMTELRSIV